MRLPMLVQAAAACKRERVQACKRGAYMDGAVRPSAALLKTACGAMMAAGSNGGPLGLSAG